MTELFGRFFRFPFLVFSKSVDVYIGAAVLSTGLRCSAQRVPCARSCACPPPLPAPPAPPVFRRVLRTASGVGQLVSQPTMMMLRNITHHPIRASLTLLGIAFATGILVVSLFVRDAMEHLIDVTYFLADRQDATISFVEKRPPEVVGEVARLPGVLAAEPLPRAPVRIRSANVERRIVITGRTPDADLSRIIDVDLRPVSLPENGLAISALAEILGVGSETASAGPPRWPAPDRHAPHRRPGRGLLRHPGHDGPDRARAAHA